LLVNQTHRRGALNAVLVLVVAVLGLLLGAALFVVFFLLGLLGLAHVEPAVLMYVWDGLVAVFLISWGSGTLAELQRADDLSLDKFMHLPVSPRGAFLLNYVSSLFCLCLAFFLPPMLGLSLGLIASRGLMLALVLPVLAAFLLMVTALTYQFQGWLAALMVNKRRRRTVMVAVTMFFILLCQVPNLINLYGPWHTRKPAASVSYQEEQTASPRHSDRSGETTSEKDRQREQKIRREDEARSKESAEQTLHQLEQTTRLVNLVLPIGWLPLGVAASAEGNVLPVLIGTLGMTLIGLLSLGRAYRTTVRLYTGQFSSGRKSAAVATPVVARSETVPQRGTVPQRVAAQVSLLERQLPLISEQASAVALAGLRSLLRAPEMKLAFLSQFILLAVFGSMILTRVDNPPELVRPLLALSAMGIALLGLVHVVGNQFGLDRNSFRAYVLSAAPRREILLGKNLAAAPLPLMFAGIALVVLQIRFPMRIDHFLAVLPQLLTLYLLFCMLANWLSLFAPMRLRVGSLRASNARMLPILLQIAFLCLFPWAMAAALLPLAAEFILVEFAGLDSVPVYLMLSLVEFVASIFLYRLVLNLQGRVLQAREMKILEVVATRDE
jgi:hypothetical protein